jgi:uncharacterized protein (TIGR02145 family)
MTIKKTLFFTFSILLLACTKEIDSSKTGKAPTVPGGTTEDTTKTTGGTTGDSTTDFSSSYGATISDVDGNSYKTFIIGKQQWMAENLKTSKYNDGTVIPNVILDSVWTELSSGAWCYYDNNSKYNDRYGKLYNWFVVDLESNGNKNVCPTGWHVPSPGDWGTLVDYLGGEKIAGGKLKEIGLEDWIGPNVDASNISLFSGLPGGYRSNAYGETLALGNVGLWWSSYGISSYGRHFALSFGSAKTYTEYSGKQYGFNIRCLKDTQK